MKFASNKLNLETGGYFVIWIGAVLYACFHVKLASNELFVQDDESSNGWRILGGKRKDASDYEWELIIYLFNNQCLWICLHLIISELLRWKSYNKLIPYVQITVSLTYLIFNFNVFVLFLILLQPILFEIIGKFKQKLAIWICEIFCLFVLHGYRNCSRHECISYFDIHISDIEHITIVLTLFWVNLRCVSYAIYKIDKNISKSNMIIVLSYCLYLPLFSNGPFVDVDDFIKSQNLIGYTFLKRITKCIMNLLRFTFWMAFTDFLLHYIFVSSISYYPMFVETFDYWTLFGYGYCMGQYFHMKYVVLYGISTTLAKFENIAAPNAPKCIGRIHLYSDMWRYFDNGLYTFLLRYIYLPLIKNKISPYLARFATFCFIYVWHGLGKDIMIWAFLNYVCVTIESAFLHFYKVYLRKRCEKSLSNAWRQRLGCALAAPLLAVSAISNFYFFAGVEIGNIFFKRVLSGDVQMKSILLFCLYCCSQVSTYIKSKENFESQIKNT